MSISNIKNAENIKNQSFKGIGSSLVNGMVKAQDAVLGAGVATTFVCQDFLGSEAPRVITGLFRNSDKTGELNYKFAAMEACREFLTAPIMMFLPIGTFALANKYIGEAIKTPVSAIESFTDKMKSAYTNIGAKKDEVLLKQKFYETSWSDAIQKTCGPTYKTNKRLIENLSSLMVKLESATNKADIKKYTDEITSLVSEEIKGNTNVKNSFSRVVYKDALKKNSSMPIGSFVDHMCRFAKDSIKSVGDINSKDFIDNLTTFAKKRMGSRVLMNIATVAASILYVTQVPKIYKSINKTNPGLIGLEEKKDDTAEVAATTVNYEAFDKLKNADNQEVKNAPAFKGNLLGKIANTISTDGKLRKFSNAFEFDGINMSCAALLTTMGLGVVYPRVKNAYDKHDRREILTRDLVTITSLIAGAKALLKTITRGFEKMSGIAMSEKPKGYKKLPMWKRVINHLRPFGGVQVYSNNDIILKYSNVDKYKGGFEGFCKYVKTSGGNLVKLFANDETTKTNIEKMIGKPLKDATENEIMNAVKDSKNKEFVQNIINVFKQVDAKGNPTNAFIRKAKAITGVFGFMSTFVAIPLFMIFLQKFNERMTKKAIAKEQAEKKAIEQKFNAIKLTTDLNLPEKDKLNLK